MPCQDEALDALVEYSDALEDPARDLHLIVCGEAGTLPVDCLFAAGLGHLTVDVPLVIDPLLGEPPVIDPGDPPIIPDGPVGKPGDITVATPVKL